MSLADQLAAEVGEPEPKKHQSKAKPSNGEFDIFAEANGIDMIRMLDLLGIPHHDSNRGEMAECPGCKEDGALVCDGGGLKCLHDRCAEAGPKGNRGFRTNVDLVMLVQRLEALEAARWICERFGIDVPKQKPNGSSTGAPPPDDDWNPTDDDAPNAPPGGSAQSDDEPAKATTQGGCTIVDVLNQWRTEGPLIHEPTGLAGLDEVTGGGPVYGTRWYVIGAPDAGKTALLLQVGHVMSERGVTVGILAIDEEPTDLVTRLVQRKGWHRRDCETRFTSAIDSMEAHLAGLPIRFYGDGTTIETAAADLAAYAKTRADADPGSHPHGPRALLLVDSLQTVPCNKEVAALAAGARELSLREAVTERSRAIRAVASRYRLIALATSEMNRAAYRTAEAAANANDMASAAESRAVEYSGRVLLALRSVAGEKDLVEVNIPKNKHRPANVDTSKLYLRIDRASQVLSETNYEAPPEDDKSDKAMQQVASDAVEVARALLDNPGIGVRELRAEFRSRVGAGVERMEAALRRLGAAVVTGAGPRGAKPMSLNIDLLPDAVRAEIEAES